ncbi:hypothetical protein FHU26_002064 [Clostridium beijerinckii]|nr:hypothetical protein [Clostridium beijerinckii]
MESIGVKIQYIKYVSELKFLLRYYKSQGQMSETLVKMYEFTNYLSCMSDDISNVLKEVVQFDRKYKNINHNYKNNEIEEDLEIIYDIFSKYCSTKLTQVVKDDEINKDKLLLKEKILKVEKEINVPIMPWIYYITSNGLKRIKHLNDKEKEYLHARIRSYINDLLFFINSKHYEIKELVISGITLCKKIIEHLELTGNSNIEIQAKELSDCFSKFECLYTEKNFLNLNNKINNSTNKLVEHWFTEINKDNFMDYIKKIDDTIYKKACKQVGRGNKMKAVFL